jgi:hypothetical protein
LTPPKVAGPAWTETVLYSFCAQPHCADGTEPAAGVIMDAEGNLYGTTYEGGARRFAPSGVVFELTPPIVAGGSWTETVLVGFCGNGTRCRDGFGPSSGLLMDGAGNLYGTTPFGGINARGVAFELVKSQ